MATPPPVAPPLAAPPPVADLNALVARPEERPPPLVLALPVFGGCGIVYRKAVLGHNGGVCERGCLSKSGYGGVGNGG